MSSADVRDPLVIHDFRMALARFRKTCDSSLGGHATELARVKDLLRTDLAPHWKRQVTSREEAYQAARRAYLEAEGDIRDSESRRGAAGKQSSIDERIAMDKARRRREEAEEKVVHIGKCIMRLDKEGDALIAQCNSHQLALSEVLSSAISRLDQMHDRILDYLDASKAGSGPTPSSSSAESASVMPAPLDAPLPAAPAADPDSAKPSPATGGR